MSADNNTHNPLLSGGIPEFSAIGPEHALPAVEQRIGEYRDLIQTIESLREDADYESVVEAETLADDALAAVWSTISHLHGVNNTPAWRRAYEHCLEPMTRFHSERSHNRGVFRAYQALSRREDFGRQPAAIRATVEHELRDFRLAGVALPAAKRKRFAEIDLRLSELGNRFGNNVIDATEGFSEHFTDARALAGLPEAEREVLADMARVHGKSGWLANLSHPAYRAISTYAEDRALRERFHEAYVTRASDAGPQAGRWDNSPIIGEMLSLRHEQAELLGFEHHAAAQLATRMAESTDEIETFLRDLAARARPQAEHQLAELSEFAAGHGAPMPLQPWDMAYWSEKLREETLGINEEKLKPWFELEQVLEGVFDTAQRLFRLRFIADSAIDTWHPDVMYFHVHDAGDRPFAGMYLDLYSRPRKSGGAWMDVCRSRMRAGNRRQQPVAFLTCNFAPPGRAGPSLLTHDDVVTLFHEFGHCLHHLLTRIDIPAVGGINGVEWDAVELPSQLLEEWAWEAESLNRFARHTKTGEPLPDRLLARMNADRRFQGALTLNRQVEYSLVDLALHRQPDADPVEIMRRIHDEIGIMPVPDYNRYLMSFSHLFDGGYSAGYYSYLWAERMARDAFGLFRDRGLFNDACGRRLAGEILEVGSTRSMSESWQAFRNRPPALTPLLESYGIVPA